MGHFDIVIEEGKFDFDEDHRLVKNPFNNLESWLRSSPYFLGITEEIKFDKRLEDIRFIYLRFHGDRKEDRSKDRSPIWDSPFKYQILDALTIGGYEWYFAIDGWIYEKNSKCRYDLHQDLEADLRAFGEYREVRITEFVNDYHYFRKLFRVDKVICEKVVTNYFQLAWDIWQIEGFLVPKDERNEMKAFNQRNRNSGFLIDFLARYPVTFISLSDYHDDFCFITSQYSLETFKRKIRFEHLREEIRQLG